MDEKKSPCQRESGFCLLRGFISCNLLVEKSRMASNLNICILSDDNCKNHPGILEAIM